MLKYYTGHSALPDQLKIHEIQEKMNRKLESKDLPSTEDLEALKAAKELEKLAEIKKQNELKDETIMKLI